ncbi:hypothetical protein GpartN1_g4881.t1 [Galdieria partita]|uniref:DUF4460 domain-containing protein n=1 Tax=Galdieria partita TaxID=83374 RepID=A0A9C7URV1_9RHOD|nr:hypothetical protein GpartN1_g4881.t1 [Galdieria partita]
MVDRKYGLQELSCQLRTSLRRVFLRIHPDKFSDFPAEASVNKLAFQQLNHLLEDFETNSSYAETISQITCYLREVGDICKVQGVQVEKFQSTLYKLTIRTVESTRVPSSVLLLLRVLEVFNLKIPTGFEELIKELNCKSINASDSETLDDFVEKHDRLVRAHVLQSTFFSNMENRRYLPTSSSKIFGLCRQLESEMRVFVRVQHPTEEMFYSELLRLRRLLTNKEHIHGKLQGSRIFLIASDCCFVNRETGVVTLGTTALNKEWETILASSENISCCEEFLQLDSNIRKQEKIAERVLKVRRITCTKEILWNRFLLARYDGLLCKVADGSIFREHSLAPYADLFQTIGPYNLQVILTEESERMYSTSSVPIRKIFLILSDNFSQIIQKFVQQLQQFSVSWAEQKQILDSMEQLKAHLDLPCIEFDNCVPLEKRLECLRRLDKISVRVKQYFGGLYLFISNKYEISCLTGRVSIPYFFEYRELDKFLCEEALVEHKSYGF